VSEKVKSAAEHAKDDAAKRKAAIDAAAEKAGGAIKEHAAKAKARLEKDRPKAN